MQPELRSSLFPLANMDLCAQDSVFSVSSSFSCPLYPPDLSSALRGTASSNVHARKKQPHRSRMAAVCIQLQFPPPAKIRNFNKQHLFLISLLRRSALSFFFSSSYSHILMQSLVFHTTRLIRSIIQKCHSASHLFFKHYHTNTGSRTKGSKIYALHKFK